MVDIFYLEATDKTRRSLRRYRSSTTPCASSGYGYCNAHTPLTDGSVDEACRSFSNAPEASFTFSNWPTHCSCGYEFQDTDEWQKFGRTLYKRPDTGETMTIEEAPIGACWNAPWMIDRRTPPCWYIGPDGRCLIIKTPGGEFMPDARANNCTMPDDNTS